MNTPQTSFDFDVQKSNCSQIWPREEQIGNWADDFGKFLRQSVRFKRTPTVLSLFSGAGGLDIGFHDCGFQILETVEFEEKFVATLNANSSSRGYFKKEIQNTCCDIREFVPSHEEVDFIIGGPPCQPFSAAGARAAGVSGTKDNRGTLFLEYVRLLKSLQPKGFLFENVYRILGANSGKDWGLIVEAFEAAGYKLNFRILNSADYGVAQLRERLIIVGVRKDLASEVEYRFPRPTHGPDSTTGTARISASDAISCVPEKPNRSTLNGRYGNLLDDIPPGLNYSFYTEKLGHPNPIFAWRSKFSDFLYKADPDRPVRTIKALGGQYTGPFHWDSRPFVISELKRLQSFPDDYEIVGSRVVSIQQIGNSVPPQFARILAASIAAQLFSAKLPFELPLLRDGEELSFKKEKRLLTKYYEKLALDANDRKREPTSKRMSASSYSAKLTDNHSWKIQEANSTYVVSERLSKKNCTLLISVNSVASVAKEAENWKFRLSPVKQWSLPFGRIEMGVKGEKLRDMHAAWRACEHFLSRHELKADLVQLFNYYQYQPLVSVDCLKHPESTEGKFINLLAMREFVGRQFDAQELATALGVKSDQAEKYLLKLKQNGFEVRSNATNVSIDPGCFLIPYSFPTLTPLSVQKSKELFS